MNAHKSGGVGQLRTMSFLGPRRVTLHWKEMLARKDVAYHIGALWQVFVSALHHLHPNRPGKGSKNKGILINDATTPM